MDCRRSLVVALGVSLGAMGCFHKEVVSNSQAPQAANSPLDKRGKRKPKPGTCVAFGKLHEKIAIDPERTQAERDNSREQSRKAYQYALELDPDNLDALTGLARLYDNTGDHVRAIATLNKALKEYPENHSIWYQLGMSHAKHKEWDSAIECMGKAASFDPENRYYAKNYGFCLTRAGRFDEGYEVLRKAVGDAQAHYDVARMLEHLNQPAACMQHLQAALAADPNHKLAMEMLSNLQAPPAYLPPVMTAGYQEPGQ